MIGKLNNAIASKNENISRGWHIYILIFLFIFIVYLCSAPRTVVMEDDGIFILASYFNGIAHSPGYPLFTLLGHVATQIPLGSVAFRVHALSALFGAMGCVCLYVLALMLFRNKVFAITAGLCLGISRTFWSQAIIAEVYTLNILIYLILFLGAIYFVENKRAHHVKLLFFMFFIYGLGLSNHWPLLILSTPALIAILWPRIRDVFQNILPGIFFMILGLSPYVWMVIRSQMDPVISFFGPLNSLQEIWFMISREGYAGVDANIAADYADKLKFCIFALKESAIQLEPLGGALAIIGFIRQWIHWQVNVCIGLILGYLGSTLLLALLIGFNYSPMYQDIFKVYPLIAYVSLILWTVLGIKETTAFIKGRFKIGVSGRQANIIFSFLIVSTALMSNTPYNYRTNDKLAEGYALTILATLEKDAIFFTSGDLDTGALGYFNLIEKIRPDVSLYNVMGLVFNTRLVNPMNLDMDFNHKTLGNFIESTPRPIYFINSVPKLYGHHDYGLYRKIDKSLDKNNNLVIEKSEIKDFMEKLLSLESLHDPWEKMVHKLLISDYCRIATHLYFYDNPSNKLVELLKVCKGYYGLISAVGVLLTDPQPDLQFVSMLLEKAESLRHEAKDRRDYAKYDVIKGAMLEKQGHIDEALLYYRQATMTWPSEKNPAWEMINALNESNEKNPD